MKIALNATEAVDVTPSADGQGIDLAAYKFGVKVGARTATPVQIGALIFALEQALEERHTKQQARGVRCHDADACQAGQRACPTPGACGVQA